MPVAKLNPQQSSTIITMPDGSLHDINCALLLHMDGSDGSSAFKDSSLGYKTVSPASVTMSAAASKFGATSAVMTSASTLSMADSADWYWNGDFTVDFWCRLSSPQTSPTYFFRQYQDATHEMDFLINNAAGNPITFFCYSGAAFVIQIACANNLVANVWNHIALVRNGNNWFIFVNGVSQVLTLANGSFGGVMPDLGGNFVIGLSGSTVAGYIDEFRVLKGVAAWTTNFTPPTAAYPGREEYCTGNRVDPKTVLLLHGDGVDSSTNIVDSSANPKQITVVGTTQVVNDGKVVLNGTSQYLTVPSSADFTFLTSSFTVDLMVNFSAVPGASSEMRLIDCMDSLGNNGWRLNCYNYGTLTLEFVGYTSGAGVVKTAAYTFATGVWYHVAVVRNGTDVAFYVNGTVVGSATTSAASIATSGQALAIGAKYSGSNYLNGKVKNVRVSNGIARWTSSFSTSGSYATDQYTKLLLQFHGDLSDGSGTGKVVTNVGSATVIYAGIEKSDNDFLTTSWVDRLPVYPDKGAIAFNGTTDYLSIADSVDWAFGDQPFTIEFWIRLNSASPCRVYEQQASASAATYIDIQSLNSVDFMLYNSGILLEITTTTAGLVVGQWHHIAVIRGWSGSSSTWAITIDGVVKATGTYAGSFVDYARVLIVGYNSYAGNGYLNGQLDEYRISKGIARYTSNFVTSRVPFVGYDSSTSLRPDPLDVLLVRGDGVDGSTYFADSSLYSKTVTAVGTAQVAVDGKVCLNGTSQGITIPDSADWAFGTGDFTVDFWLNLNAYSAANIYTILGQRDGGGGNNYWHVSINSGAFYFDAYPGSPSRLYIGTGVLSWSAGQWYHLAVSKSGSNYYLFRDGVMVGSGTSAGGVQDVAQLLYIGTGNVFSGWSAPNCMMKNIRITKGGALWTTAFTPPTSYAPDANTKLLLQFHNGLIDESGTGKTVTNVGSAPIIYPGVLPLQGDGGAIYFNGTSTDYLSTPDSADWVYYNSDFTIEFWYMKDTGTVASRTVVYQGLDGGNNLALLYLENDQKLAFIVATSGVNQGVYRETIAQPITVGVWNHFAVCRKGNTTYMFRNGVMSSVDTLTAWATAADLAAPLNVGYSAGAPAGISGYLDELRITKGLARYTTSFVPAKVPYAGREKKQGSGMVFIPGFQQIADFVSKGTESSFSVDVNGDIDQEYRIEFRNMYAGALGLTLNGDTGSNYPFQMMFNNAGALSSASAVNTSIQLNASYQAMGVLRLLTTKGQVKRGVLTEGRFSSGTTISQVGAWGWGWNKTDNVGLMTFTPAVAPFVAGTRVTIYARRG